jgi:nicotinamidase/pyrazinamidase
MDALLVVDVQNDFMPFGSLPVTDGDAVVPVANRLMKRFGLVVATQDWHPADHGSFASNHPGSSVGDVVDLSGIPQVLWPDHCVQNTPGASFHSALDVTRIDHIVCKGVDPEIDSYSAFFDNAHRRDTGLREFLRSREVERVVIVGLATDYCVLFTALDARQADFEVLVARDGVRAVNLEPFDDERAFDEMRRFGCTVVDSGSLSGLESRRSPGGEPHL